MFTEPDRAAANLWQSSCEKPGLETRTDAVGNVIGYRRGTGSLRGALVTGSHTDTVAGGGRFDGVVGVLGAIEVARLLQESRIELQRDFIVVDFLGEEPNDSG